MSPTATGPASAMHKEKPSDSHGEPDSVTVVIPTFNRAIDLERALLHLARQSVGALRVVVVDNSSTDNTPEMIKRLMPQWQERLTYIRREPNGPASARNTGLASSMCRPCAEVRPLTHEYTP